jgi:hypothetical protein
LLRLLGEALAVGEPVPPALTEDARAVFTWRTVDAELLALGFDSAVDELTGVRSGATVARLLRFERGEIEVEVDLVEGEIEGMVVGATVTEIRLEHPDGTVTVTEPDEHGRFRFADVGAGPRRLQIDEDGPVTEWFLV